MWWGRRLYYTYCCQGHYSCKMLQMTCPMIATTSVLSTSFSLAISSYFHISLYPIFPVPDTPNTYYVSSGNLIWWHWWIVIPFTSINIPITFFIPKIPPLEKCMDLWPGHQLPSCGTTKDVSTLWLALALLWQGKEMIQNSVRIEEKIWYTGRIV